MSKFVLVWLNIKPNTNLKLLNKVIEIGFERWYLRSVVAITFYEPASDSGFVSVFPKEMMQLNPAGSLKSGLGSSTRTP